MFADVHSHVLFGIDDGARDSKETRKLLVQLRQAGTTHLALTPHYYPYKKSIHSFVEKREQAFRAFMTLPEAQNFVFSLGAEVYLSETLLNNEDVLPLCYSGTRFMLTELEYSSYFTDAAKYRLLRLVEDFGVTPVLAHIDRYPFLWKNLELLKELKRMGCRFQVNLSALKGFFSRKQFIKLYENGFLDFLGEDVHRSVLLPEEKQVLLSGVEKVHQGFTRRITNETVSRLFVKK